MRQSRPAANGYQALALAAPVAFSGTEGPEMPLRLFQGLSVALTHGVPWGTRWKFAFSPGSARLHERCLGMLPARMNSVLTWCVGGTTWVWPDYVRGTTVVLTTYAGGTTGVLTCYVFVMTALLRKLRN